MDRQYTRAELESKARKEIQALAKEFGLKANASTESIVNSILSSCVESAAGPAPVVAAVTEPTTSEPVVETVVAAEPMEVAAPADVKDVVESVIQSEPKSLASGDCVEVLVDGAWKRAVIKRINKKSVRACLSVENTEVTVKNEEIRQVCDVSNVADMEAAEAKEDVAVSETTNAEEVIMSATEPSLVTAEVVVEPPAAVVAATSKTPKRGKIFSLASNSNTPLCQTAAVSFPAQEADNHVENSAPANAADDAVDQAQLLASFNPSEEWASSMEICLQELNTKLRKPSTPAAASQPETNEFILDDFSAETRTPRMSICKSDRKRKSIEIGASLANLASILTAVEPKSVKLVSNWMSPAGFSKRAYVVLGTLFFRLKLVTSLQLTVLMQL
jgi:hypothetical protein